VKYRFINGRRHEYGVATMCRVLRVSRSGFYQWPNKPRSDRALEDRRWLGLIRASNAASGGVHGALRIFLGLRERRRCDKNRVARLMRSHKNKATCGCKTLRVISGRPSIVSPNRLQRDFTVDRRNVAWVTDITYIRTWQGWLYLAVVVDLYSRLVIGWSMKPTLAHELLLDALTMAVWRRRPTDKVLAHSDQVSQYGSADWLRFFEAHDLEPSTSRRGNCWNGAVAESFFSSLKKERIKRRIYKTRDLARADVVDYIEAFYNRTRRQSHTGGISPEAFERASKQGFGASTIVGEVQVDPGDEHETSRLIPKRGLVTTIRSRSFPGGSPAAQNDRYSVAAGIPASHRPIDRVFSLPP
jgi:putative transposase